MARLVSFEAWNINTVNLYWYDEYATGSLLQTTGFTFQGIAYQDLFTVQASDGFDSLELDFLGSGITVDAGGNVLSGTVNAIIELDRATNTILWFADGLSTNALSIYNAALTASNQDEINLIQLALAGNDTIAGNIGNDVISGFSGLDTLTGGGGNDIFSDTRAGHNGDTITDLSIGDAVIFSDASLATFTFSVSSNTLNYNGGSITLSGAPQGKFVASAASGGGVQLLLMEPTHHVHNDFNGDGIADLLFRNDNGLLAEWTAQANGSFVGNANVNYPLAASWHVAGTGDFNGDGYDDLLLRHDNGMMAEWNGQSNGGFAGNANVNYPLATSWHVAGIGDFNGDGFSDLLLRNDNGMMAEWNGQANGSFVGNANVNYALGTDWQIAGTGDFNGDGMDDLLLRNNNGSLAEWSGQANGGFVGNASVSNLQLGTYWHVIGTGDFNGDGVSDFLSRNDDGGMVAWTGPSSASNANYALGTDWHVVSIGDFNADGRSDLLLRNDNGIIAEWTGQSDSSFAGNAVVNYPLTTAWQVQDPFVHDLTGSGAGQWDY
jgi:hypothetical protein